MLVFIEVILALSRHVVFLGYILHNTYIIYYLLYI